MSAKKRFQLRPETRGIMLGYCLTVVLHQVRQDYLGLEGTIESLRSGWLPTWGVLNLAMYATYFLLILGLVFGPKRGES